MKKLRIFLADCVYDTVKTNFTVPLNISYIAAYCEHVFGNQVEIEIFKYPAELIDRIKSDPPNLLGLSNYSWNTILSSFILECAKKYHPNIVTVMGGPNISASPRELEQFLFANRHIDYYTIYEGEVGFSNIVGKVLGGGSTTELQGVAYFKNRQFSYNYMDYKPSQNVLEVVSPYLTGWLDKFIADANMIPLLETNRGCPYRCVYCTWGAATLSRIKQKPLEMVFEEIEYVATKSAGQNYWIFCDANFGIFPRDMDIATKIRKVKDRKGYPSRVELWHSKNSGRRNIDIVKTIGGDAPGYIAIQSSDTEVLRRSGRGKILFDELKEQIDYYKENNMPTQTDLLIGLPGETAQSHLQSICDAFEFGFNIINPINIRLLKGSSYETNEMRREYGVKGKYRPIFGSYGVYGGHKVFEVEESVRATRDFSEEELNRFKVVHWLIYFCWNSGLFSVILNMASANGINPGVVLNNLANTANPRLRNLFDTMLNDSMAEWFITEEEMRSYYNNDKHFNTMIKNFAKLNFLYIAKVYTDIGLVKELENEMITLIRKELAAKGVLQQIPFDEILKVTEHIVCKNLLLKHFSETVTVSGVAARYIINNKDLAERDTCILMISRSEDAEKFCNEYGGTTLSSMLRFLEAGGLAYLTNNVQLV